jgi:hypothetical protein
MRISPDDGPLLPGRREQEHVAPSTAATNSEAFALSPAYPLLPTSPPSLVRPHRDKCGTIARRAQLGSWGRRRDTPKVRLAIGDTMVPACQQ